MNNIYEDPIWWRRNVKKGDWVKIRQKGSTTDYPIILIEVAAMHPHTMDSSIFVIEDTLVHRSIHTNQIDKVLEVRHSQLEYVEAQIDPTVQYRERLRKDEH